MSVQSNIFTALKGLVGNRVYPQTAPDNPTTPYIVYSRIASAPENTLADGQPINQTRVQIDIFDTSYDNATSLAAQVVTAMTGAGVGAVQLLERDQYESIVKLHRVIQDYSIWTPR